MQALARLLYSAHDVVVLDDPFSALDGNTENTVVDNLLGPNGWFKEKKTAVFLVTNSGQFSSIHLNVDRVLTDLNSSAFSRCG